MNFFFFFAQRFWRRRRHVRSTDGTIHAHKRCYLLGWFIVSVKDVYKEEKPRKHRRRIGAKKKKKRKKTNGRQYDRPPLPVWASPRAYFGVRTAIAPHAYEQGLPGKFNITLAKTKREKQKSHSKIVSTESETVRRYWCRCECLEKTLCMTCSIIFCF